MSKINILSNLSDEDNEKIKEFYKKYNAFHDAWLNNFLNMGV